MSEEHPIPQSAIQKRIYSIRGELVILDRDIAELYGVETRTLKQAVRRNLARFPEDFMFEMSDEEFKDWRSHFVTSKEDKKGLRYAPFCFTEQGVAMLSGILKSEQAVKMNIQIIRSFIALRKMALNHQDILQKLDKLEQKSKEQDSKIKEVFDYLRAFIEEKQKPREKIGFKTKGQERKE